MEQRTDLAMGDMPPPVDLRRPTVSSRARSAGPVSSAVPGSRLLVGNCRSSAPSTSDQFGTRSSAIPPSREYLPGVCVLFSRPYPSGVYHEGIEMSENVYQVTGMTCGHCEMSVREEVEQVAGVTALTVNAQTGKLVVTSAEPIDDSAVLSAVEEAGYSAVRV